MNSDNFPQDFRPPGVTIQGPPSQAYRSGILLAGKIGVLMGVIIAILLAIDYVSKWGFIYREVLLIPVYTCVIFGVISIIARVKRGMDYSVMGIVTYLHAANTSSKDSTCYLSITDNDWNFLKDKKGGSLPAVKVGFSSDIVEGPPLKEGSKIILKGRLWADKSKPVEAKQIWNLSPGEDTNTSDAIPEVEKHKKIHDSRSKKEQITKTQGTTLIISLERTIYEPVNRDFILSSPRPLTNVKNWIEKNDPSMYWFILCIHNNSEQPIDEWGIELQTQNTLKILDTRIEGSEQSSNVNKSSSKPWLTHWVIGIPHTLGIVIPRKGSKRVYFKLGSDACGVDYSIEGKVTTSDYEIPIEKKDFKYSCDVVNLKVAIRTNPKDAEKYAETVLLNNYGKETALKLLHSFRIMQEIDRCCIPDRFGETKFSDKGYSEIREKLHVLLGALDSTKVGDNLVRMVKDSLDMMSIAGETNASAERIRKLCGNLPDMWINEVMKI